MFDFSTDAAPLLCCLIEEVAQFAANFTWGGEGGGWLVDFMQLLFLKGTVNGKF